MNARNTNGRLWLFNNGPSFELHREGYFYTGGRRKPLRNTGAVAVGSIRFFLIGTLLSLSACANTLNERDDMCPAIAVFANAASADRDNSVRLMTDWGGVYYKSEDPKEQVFYAKNCMHDAFEPGKELCKYLLENTSTEFPAMNYRRALECIGVKSRGHNSTDDRLPPSVTARSIPSLRHGVVVKISFTESTDTEPPTLTILSRQKR